MNAPLTRAALTMAPDRRQSRQQRETGWTCGRSAAERFISRIFPDSPTVLRTRPLEGSRDAGTAMPQTARGRASPNALDGAFATVETLVVSQLGGVFAAGDPARELPVCAGDDARGPRSAVYVVDGTAPAGDDGPGNRWPFLPAAQKASAASDQPAAPFRSACAGRAAGSGRWSSCLVMALAMVTVLSLGARLQRRAVLSGWRAEPRLAGALDARRRVRVQLGAGCGGVAAGENVLVDGDQLQVIHPL